MLKIIVVGGVGSGDVGSGGGGGVLECRGVRKCGASDQGNFLFCYFGILFR